MVRFSDMLGGDGESDDARPATAARDEPPLVADEPPDAPPVDEAASAEIAGETAAETTAADPSPQDVLDRLTQYATATRAVAAPAESESEATPPPAPAASPPDADPGDDILPRARRSIRSPRGKRRDP
jgi:hypothetical protein